VGNSFKIKVMTSIRWVLVGHFSALIIRLAGNLVLTRLLLPDAFGLMAIVSVFMFVIAMFTDIGATQHFVQSDKVNDKRYVGSIYFIQIMQGAIIFLAAFLLGVVMLFPFFTDNFPVGSVYADDKLPWLIIGVSFNSLIGGFKSPNILLLHRNLQQKKLIILNTLSQALGLMFMIFGAWYYSSVWALVAGGWVSVVLRVFGSHLHYFGEKHTVIFNRDAIREILNFGKWIVLSSVIGAVVSQGDKVLFGLWMTPRELGIYSIAFTMCWAVTNIISRLIGSIFFPLLSDAARSEDKDIADVYYSIRGKVDIFTMSAAGLMVGAGDLIIMALYNDEYIEAGNILRALSISICFAGYNLAGSCFVAKGDSRTPTIMTAIKATFLMLTMIGSNMFWGLPGAIIAVGLAGVINIPSSFYFMRKAGYLRLSREFFAVPLFIIFLVLSISLKYFIFGIW
jgi:O-antigen/teichoic acid export membrane protein